MRLFQEREVREALAHAAHGGQALHLGQAMPGLPGAPACFRRASEWGHLIDYDGVRLLKTARRLGVRRVVVGHLGERGQHVDLCGRPLARAMEEARKGAGDAFAGPSRRSEKRR